MSKTFDLVILNATVVDGSGTKPFVADVAVKNDRIERIGSVSAYAKKIIDAYGKILTPGFIDIHGHSDYSILANPLAHSKVFQGVTTEVNGNCGYHAAPCFGAVAQARKEEYSRSLSLNVDWTTLQEYQDRLRAVEPSINYVPQLGYNTIRSAVTGDVSRPLSAQERDEINRIVEDGYREGATGLSYGIAYAPACFASTQELEDVAHITADHGGLLSFHIRDEGDQLLESLQEALQIIRASGAKSHIGHLKTFRRRNWHKIDEMLTLLSAARSSGVDLSVDRYPHLAMNTQLKFALPIWTLEGGVEATKAVLLDPVSRKKVIHELEQTVQDEVKGILISLVTHAHNKKYEGYFLDQIADHHPWELLCDLVAEEGEAAFATFLGMNRENLDKILALDWSIVASDASVQAVERQAGGGRPHPRCFDTFPYFLAEWVYATGRLSLEDAVRKITSLPALRSGIYQRGLIAEGYFADLTLLSATSLEAQVNYEQPLRYPRGVSDVIVNGMVVVEQGKHTGLRAGRLILKNAVD